jgi:hypothetical protein
MTYLAQPTCDSVGTQPKESDMGRHLVECGFPTTPHLPAKKPDIIPKEIEFARSYFIMA